MSFIYVEIIWGFWHPLWLSGKGINVCENQHLVVNLKGVSWRRGQTKLASVMESRDTKVSRNKKHTFSLPLAQDLARCRRKVESSFSERRRAAKGTVIAVHAAEEPLRSPWWVQWYLPKNSVEQVAYVRSWVSQGPVKKMGFTSNICQMEDSDVDNWLKQKTGDERDRKSQPEKSEVVRRCSDRS